MKMQLRKQSGVSIMGLSGVVLAVLLLASGIAGAAIIGLGQAANYAVLGIGGTVAVQSDFEVYQSATVINGNVGVGPYSTWTHGVDATINGRIDYDLTDSAPTVTGTVTGGLHQVSMSGPVADARSASTLYAGLSPTLTLGGIADNATIVGNGGLNVIRITNEMTLKTTLTLQGTPSDSFVFQLTASDAPSAHNLTLSGLSMSLTGGVTAGNILWNLDGFGGGIVISSSSLVDGIFLAPDRSILVDNANVTGAVFGGGGYQDSHSDFVSVHSSATIMAIPEPNTFALGAVGLALLAVARRHS